MFPIYTEAQLPRFTWQGKEVVREVNHKPHLFVRLSIRGAHFPQRAAVPMMRIVQGDRMVARSWFTEISDDNATLHGYFATDLPNEGFIEFAYAGDPPARVHAVFTEKEIKRLERKELHKEVVVVLQADVKKRKG